MLESIFEGIKSFLGDTLTSVLEAVLNATIFKLLYYAEIGLCWIIGQLYEMFRVFAGLVRIRNGEQYDYLVNVFFTNPVVSNIYWAFALIGIALTFGFAIWAVVRKMFDLDGRQQASLGQIIGAGLKSILIIVSMTLIISEVLYVTNKLMEQVSFIFDNAYHLSYPQERDFSEEEYAAMGRVLATIGNASMVPNSRNRYNVNLCYNEIRGDMLYLQQQGVFLYSYYQTDQNGNEVKSWQSVLSQIAHSVDLRYDMKIDVYQQGVMTSITAAMDYLQSGGNIVPVSHVGEFYKSDGTAHLDRLVFLLGSLRAARNSAYNQKPSFTDALRAPYYYEQGRSIYDFDNVDDDFNIGFPTDYILVFMAAFALIMDLITILLNCVARIFNMLFLYIIAPPVIASGPLDGGGKFKQWTTAFVVQSLSVFGTVISMRLLMIYLPIVIDPQLVLFEDRPLLNALSKFVLIFGGFEAAKKSTSLLTGILADSAGWQAVQAGDMSGSAGKLAGGVAGVAKGAAGLALKTAGGVANFATKPVQNLGARAWAATGGKWSNLGKADEATQQAKQSLAVEDAKQKLMAERGGGENPPANQSGSANPPASQSGSANPPANQSGSANPPANQSGSASKPGGPGNSGPAAPKQPDAPKPPAIPKAPPPPPPPGSAAAKAQHEVAQRSAALHKAMANKVDAQGNLKSASGGGKDGAAPPASGGGEQTRKRLGGGITGQGWRDAWGIGYRPTLGDKPTAAAAPRSKEAPGGGSRRPTLEQMEKQADLRRQAAFRAAHTVSTHTSVGGSTTAGGSYTAESGGSRMSLKEKAPDLPSRPREEPDMPRKRPTLDD